MDLSLVIPQIQPTRNTCAHTCLSMLSGLPVGQFIIWHGDAGMHISHFETYLEQIRLPWQRVDKPTVRGWYSASMPSLNGGCGHKILFHLNADGCFTVLDPTIGENKYARDGSNVIGQWRFLHWVLPRSTKPITMKDPFFN